MKKILTLILILALTVGCAHKVKTMPAIGMDGNATLVQVEQPSTAEKVAAVTIFLLNLSTSIFVGIAAAQ